MNQTICNCKWVALLMCEDSVLPVYVCFVSEKKIPYRWHERTQLNVNRLITKRQSIRDDNTAMAVSMFYILPV